jgi:TonB family protein
MRCVILLFLFVLLSVSANAEIVCPDESALKLLAIAKNAAKEPEFARAIASYSYVIEHATRRMDGRALKTACSLLAGKLYWSKHYNPGSNPIGPIPPDEAIKPLKAEYPILQRCPDKAIHRDSWLPIIRVPHIPSKEALTKEITGWVTLEIVIDERGDVEKAVVTDSSSSVLEPSAVEAVSKFKYKPRLDDDRFVRATGVEATIVTDYFHLAWAEGCRWDEPSF